MKTIGLIGGFSWHSTVEYYRLLNQFIGDEFGAEHAAELVLVNCDSRRFKDLIDSGDREKALGILLSAAKRAESGGAEFLLLCANALHRFYDEIQSVISIPILHIADAAGIAIQRQGLKRVGLLGVRPTMEGTFYPERLKRLGIETIVPDADDISRNHHLIYSELEIVKFADETRTEFLGFIDGLVMMGAEGVILGCTEIPLLIRPEDTNVMTFSTTEIHCRAAIAESLRK